MSKSIFIFSGILFYCFLLPGKTNGQKIFQAGEKYRPEIHFTPHKGWMNDPNGMVYAGGIYHLFFQYNPDSTVWGPMHWGHAISTDLIHWQEQRIALYPDSLGTIFSGSAVIDKDNTAGFGKNALIAIYTNHNAVLEKMGSDTFQTQSIAFSIDNGKTWKKYGSNPVLRNPGIRDFRDPKVFWYQPERRWIMSLATHDHIAFYSSADLKTWKEVGKFGKNTGAHGGVWECPDLLPFMVDGKQVWLLIVNLNPGGPNGGSATQYFIGKFDGRSFTPFDNQIRWLDYGPDEYAGVTWSNTGDRKIFLGWMSNWQYANVVPTKNWRSAMTIPRELSIKKAGKNYWVASKPVKELDNIVSHAYTEENIQRSNFKLTEKTGALKGSARLRLNLAGNSSFSVILSNDLGENVTVGYDKNKNEFFIDRIKSGNVSFEKGFGGRHTAPRFTTSPEIKLDLVVDVASVELFADDGLTAMTSIFFPDKYFNNLTIKTTPGQKIKKLIFQDLTIAE